MDKTLEQRVGDIEKKLAALEGEVLKQQSMTTIVINSPANLPTQNQLSDLRKQLSLEALLKS